MVARSPEAWLLSPPLTVAVLPLAVFHAPPPTVARNTLAVLFSPPLTVLPSPWAAFVKPPPTVACPPAAALCFPPATAACPPPAILARPPPTAAQAPLYAANLLVTRPFAVPAKRTLLLAWRVSFPRHKAIDALRRAIQASSAAYWNYNTGHEPGSPGILVENRDW